MSQESAAVREFWGAIVVSRDEGDMTRRWWFDTTEDGRLVFTTRVDHSEMFESRNYLDSSETGVPKSVVEHLVDEGFEDGIFSPDAKRFWAADEMREMGS